VAKRKNPTPTQRDHLTTKNAGRCCVCKRRGVGLHLHHIDGNHANTIDENIAVLCVEDHDQHHRPSKYTKTQHLELSAEKLLEYKNSWELFVEDATSEHPSVIAVINAFGTIEHLHAARIIFQWPNEKIEFERTFHLLEGDFDYWTDEMFAEVDSIGKNVKITLIDEPLPVDYCPCCRIAYSNIVKEGLVTKVVDPRWDTQSVMSIYINPSNPSLAISINLPDKNVFSANLHLCQGTYLHLTSDYYDERVKVKKEPSIRTQATQICEKIISDWQPAHLMIGTGDHDNPEIIDNFLLPKIWERRVSSKENLEHTPITNVL
jgi:hypothetical protein